MQIQISWLLQKPTDLDLHCLQNRIYPGSAGQGLSICKLWLTGLEESEQEVISIIFLLQCFYVRTWNDSDA